MKNKFRMYFFGIFFVMSLMSGLLIFKGWMQTKKDGNINCQASFVVSNYNLTMPVLASIRFNNGKGVVFYDGPVYESGKRIGMLSRQVDFKAEHKNHILILTGTSISSPPKDDISQDKAELTLPDFFVKPHASIFYTLRRDGNGYFFIKDGVPMFYCRVLGL